MKFHHPEGTDTPLKLALSKNYIDIAKFLIENGADIHYTAETYLPWFYIRDVGMADYFLRHGADVNTLNYFGENLLFRHPSNDLLKFLISKGINVNQQTKTTSPTPLFTEINSFDNVKILLENGADPNIKNYLGETALDKARDNRVIRLLQQYGAENGDFRGYF
jgi:ankyrin repeat protein